MEFQTAIMGAIGAAVIAASGYLKARGEGEAFNFPKFAQTAIIGAIAGFTLGMSGVTITDQNVEVQMASYAFLGGGIAVLIENVGKYFYRGQSTTATSTIPSTATQDAPLVVSTGTPGFIIPRDGKKLYDGLDGWWVRINPSPEAATIPDDKCYQAVSAHGTVWSGDKDTIKYLVSSSEASGWRTRNA